MSPRFLTSLELFLKGANLASRPASSAPSPSFPGLTKAAAMSFFVQLKQTDWRSRQEGLQWSSLLTSSQDTPQWPGPAGSKGTQELQTHFLQHKRRQQSAHSGHKGEESSVLRPPRAQRHTGSATGLWSKGIHGQEGKGAGIENPWQKPF